MCICTEKRRPMAGALGPRPTLPPITIIIAIAFTITITITIAITITITITIAIAITITITIPRCQIVTHNNTRTVLSRG